MPHSAIDAGVVDYALPLPALAQELARLSRHPYISAETPPAKNDERALNQLFVFVRNAIGVDFSEYKVPTFERRLARRMALRQVEGLPAYLEILRREPDEIRSLYEDVLIHVTSFFRDPEVFEGLRAQVIPQILHSKVDGAPLRAWVAGCSTGEEVYSLGIALLELLGGNQSHPIQIFGSDVSEKAIEKARLGVYPDSAMNAVSDERRRRYFSKVDAGYRINKAVRDLCVFVRHDLARDPPFSRLDLVSCRNVLIYFDQPLQKRVLLTFHYALNQPGFLLLGRTENISGFGQLFAPLDKSIKVFARNALRSTLQFAPRLEVHPSVSDRTHTTLSHELRTPLSTMLMQAQLLRRTDDPKMQRAGETIERATMTQVKLIDDLLDVSRIVAGKLRMEVEPVDLRSIVRAAVENLATQLEKKQIKLEVVLAESIGKVSGDAARLQQVVANLLTNAIKFTPASGRVTIRLEAVQGRAQLTVSDNGIGIDPAFLQDVFNRFSQADGSSTRSYGGLGLGRAIVRHLVEAHGGTVSAESAGPGKGATFVVTLPLLATQVAEEGGDAATAGVAAPIDCSTSACGSRTCACSSSTTMRRCSKC